MSFTVEKHPDLPVVISTLYNGFDIAGDSDAFAQELLTVLDAMDEPVYTITDTTRYDISFSDLVTALATFTRGSFVALFNDPRVIKSLVVDHHDLARLAVNALGQAQYGGFSVTMYASLDDALAEIKAATVETAR